MKPVESPPNRTALVTAPRPESARPSLSASRGRIRLMLSHDAVTASIARDSPSPGTQRAVQVVVADLVESASWAGRTSGGILCGARVLVNCAGVAGYIRLWSCHPMRRSH